jgi:hypothetical protein
MHWPRCMLKSPLQLPLHCQLPSAPAPASAPIHQGASASAALFSCPDPTRLRRQRMCCCCCCCCCYMSSSALGTPSLPRNLRTSSTYTFTYMLCMYVYRCTGYKQLTSTAHFCCVSSPFGTFFGPVSSPAPTQSNRRYREERNFATNKGLSVLSVLSVP